jgi:hypothetical protein
MNQAAPSGATRRGFSRPTRWLLMLCGLPPLAFALSNLWLASPSGRTWLAAKIQLHSGGLATRVGGASWSPWNGVTLREIVISQPPELSAAIADPLARISSLRLTPVWTALWHRRWALRDADIESPRIVMSAQMLSQLAQQAAGPTAPLAAIEPTSPPIASLQPASQSPPQLTPPPAPATPEPGGGPPLPGAPPPSPPSPPSPPVAAAAPQPTVWIRLRHASLQLVSATTALRLLEITDLTSELPVSGDAANSTLGLASVKVGGRSVLADFQAPLAWQAPVLSLKPVATTLDGLRCQVAGKLALLNGLPMQLEVQLPQQSPAPLALPGGVVATATQLATSGRFRGLLLAPATWQGDCHVECAAVSANVGDLHASFDRGTCFIALRGGVLSCVDARLVGDELSLLGNATLFADGRAAGVLRLVAPPETALGIVKRLFPKSAEAPALTPMATPQRAACDLAVFGILTALQVQLGHNGPIVPLPMNQTQDQSAPSRQTGEK